MSAYQRVWVGRKKRDQRIDKDSAFSGFPCPICPCPKTYVCDGRSIADGSCFRRRRYCKKCGYRFTTREIAEVYHLDYQI